MAWRSRHTHFFKLVFGCRTEPRCADHTPGLIDRAQKTNCVYRLRCHSPQGRFYRQSEKAVEFCVMFSLALYVDSALNTTDFQLWTQVTVSPTLHTWSTRSSKAEVSRRLAKTRYVVDQPNNALTLPGYVPRAQFLDAFAHGTRAFLRYMWLVAWFTNPAFTLTLHSAF